MPVSFEPLAVAFLTALILSLLAGPVLIPVLRRLKFGQSIREDGPQRHFQKAGTPTMGGLIFLAAMTAAVAMVVWSGRVELSLGLGIGLLVILGFGAIGFADDFIKVALKRPLGLRAREKLAAQVVLAAAVWWAATLQLGLGTEVQVPFTETEVRFGPLYSIFVLLVLLGASNAVNITDGLDGLAAGSSTASYLALMLIGVYSGVTEAAVISAAMIGGLLGFLRYNLHPAMVFMGDTGSMALGGGLGVLAILTKTELLLPIIGGLFVIETLSVIIQVASFRLLGRRVFKMSPIHHHFELCGWSETQVVRWFWALAALLALIGLTGLKGRGV